MTSGVAVTLGRVVRALDGAGIPHMIVGSFASTFHGEPRTTHDVDFVIQATEASLEALLGRLPQAEYYVDAGTARDALARGSMFNVIDLETGWKVDLILAKGGEFARSEFERRKKATLFGVEVFVASAEDTILAKLSWAREGGSERQLRDVRGVIAAVGEGLDRAYVEHWAEALGVVELWRSAVGPAGDDETA